VPPAIVNYVFQELDNFGRFQHPAQKIFECSAYVGADKQLECCGMEYDRFRALYSLPVVPHDMTVANRGELSTAWFRGLVFDKEVARTTKNESIFIMDGHRKEVRRTNCELDSHAYFFPSAKNHPWIDRACVAEHPASGERCLVIYQDKASAAKFSEAVDCLNKAANALESGFKSVLCIAQVIGASDAMRAQQNFEHPYILIRDHEVESFYTRTFAPAVRFIRDRNSLA